MKLSFSVLGNLVMGGPDLLRDSEQGSWGGGSGGRIKVPRFFSCSPDLLLSRSGSSFC